MDNKANLCKTWKQIGLGNLLKDTFKKITRQPFEEYL